MSAVNLKSLVGKLGDLPRQTLESAAGLCLSRTNYNVEVEHWLIKLLEPPHSDIALILKHYDIDSSNVAADLTRTLDRLKTGNSRAPALSPSIVDLAREAWVLASLEYGAPRVRSGHILTALLSDDAFHRMAREASPPLGKIQVPELRASLLSITAKSEEGGVQAEAVDTSAPGAPQRKVGGKTPALDQYTNDMTEAARSGKMDPIVGRDFEIRQIIDILTRRRQNNPIMTGEAGVGKTAVVEGFAQRIVEGDVPSALQNVSLRELDLGLLQAGAGVKGEFENRLKQVIQEVKSSPTPIILFIDEAHTMIGAGGAAGQGDAANLLKPALARGELRTVAATTWAEYKKYFEKDPALTRRFQVVKVEEPTEEVAVAMMRGLVGALEKHHGVRILDEAVFESVRLSSRYISGRQLPDKSVSVLDTACARVNLSQTSVPPAIEDARREIALTETAIGIQEREAVTGTDHDESLAKLRAKLDAATTRLADLEDRASRERVLVDRVRAIQGKLSGEDEDSAGDQAADTAVGEPLPEGADALKVELERVTDELRGVQGEEPLIHVCVDGPAIAEVIAGWTGVPVGRMVGDEIRSVLELKDRMAKRVVGQDHALNAISQAIRTARANLSEPTRPVGVFLMCGTSGVGKTETAIALAEELYGGEQNMSVINMSEFKEEHKVSLLMGSPPGYVGYGEGGVLTEAVRRRPYSVVLLDEMEKAHPGVQDIFYQVFDKGRLRDGEGRDIDFRNTVVIMTSNAGTDTIMKLCADPETMPDEAGLAEALRPELLKVFKPAFLGRVVLVPYFPLHDDVMRKIIGLKLGKVRKRIEAHYGAPFEVSEDVVDNILARCTEVDSGARNVDHILVQTLLPELSAAFLENMAEGHAIRAVNVGLNEAGGFRYDIENV